MNQLKLEIFVYPDEKLFQSVYTYFDELLKEENKPIVDYVKENLRMCPMSFKYNSNGSFVQSLELYVPLKVNLDSIFAYKNDITVLGEENYLVYNAHLERNNNKLNAFLINKFIEYYDNFGKTTGKFFWDETTQHYEKFAFKMDIQKRSFALNFYYTNEVNVVKLNVEVASDNYYLFHYNNGEKMCALLVKNYLGNEAISGILNTFIKNHVYKRNDHSFFEDFYKIMENVEENAS